MIAVIGLHLMLLTVSSLMLETVENVGCPAAWLLLITLFLRAAQLLIPAAVAYAVSGVSLRKAEMPDNIFSRFSGISLFFSGVAALVAVRWLVLGITELLGRIGILLPGSSVSYQHDVWGIVTLLLASAVLPAVCEELFYRRLLLQILLPFGVIPTVIFTSLLFGIMHSYPQAILYATLSGVVLGVCALHNDSMKLCISIHLTVNLLTVLRSTLPLAPGILEGTAYTVLNLVEIAVILLGTASFLFELYTHTHIPREK